MSDLGKVTAPLLDCFATCCHRQFDSVVQEDIAKLCNSGWVGLIDYGMVDISYGRPRFDASIFVDEKDFVQSSSLLLAITSRSMNTALTLASRNRIFWRVLKDALV